MGIDTEIFISYGIVISIEEGKYLKNTLENDTTDTNILNFLEKIEFSYDNYLSVGNEMCIHLKSSKNILFDMKTGGNAGRGCGIYDSQIDVSEKDIKDFKFFSQHLFKKIKENEKFKYVQKETYVPGNVIYYYNW